MPNVTSNMGLEQAVDSDNAKQYLDTYLYNSLGSIDTDDHSSSKGVPVKRLQNGAFTSRPAAGNAGHVYVATDANRVSWDNGSSWIEAVLNGTTLAVTLSGGLSVGGGLHLSSGQLYKVDGSTLQIGTQDAQSFQIFTNNIARLTIDSSGGLSLPTSTVGVGATEVGNAGVVVGGTPFSGAVTSQYDYWANGTGTSVGTNERTGFQAQPATAPSTAVTTVTGFHAVNPIKGAGGSITHAYGLLVDGMSGIGGTDNYGIYVGTMVGGSGNNFGIYVASGSSVGVRIGGGTTAGLMIDTGGLLLSGTPTPTNGTFGLGSGNAVPNGTTANLTGTPKGTGSGPSSLAVNTWIAAWNGTTAGWIPFFV